MDLVGHGFEHVLQELPGRLSVSCCDELSDGELGRPVDADEQVKFPFASLHLRDIDVKEADGVARELLPLGLVTLEIWQPRDAMSLQASMQRRTGQMRDRRLQGIKAVIERKQRMAPERYDRRLFGLGQDGGPRFRRPGLHVLDRRALAPFRHSLGVDAEFPAQLRERSLRSLYCSSDGVRGRGAPVTNLSHNASFHSREWIAPSNRGIKRLTFQQAAANDRSSGEPW